MRRFLVVVEIEFFHNRLAQELMPPEGCFVSAVMYGKIYIPRKAKTSAMAHFGADKLMEDFPRIIKWEVKSVREITPEYYDSLMRGMQNL